MILIVFIFVAILAFLVLIHEFGHFFAAKKLGILVEEFGIGFPPRVLGKKIGETIYSINLLPIGGFVRVYGEMFHETPEEGKDQKRSFVAQKPWKKSLVLLAGIGMNVLLAVIIYYILLASAGFRSDPIPLLHSYSFPFGNTTKQIIVGRVVSGSPAEKAGVATGDLVERLSSDGKSWMKIETATEMIDQISALNDAPVYLELKNINNGTIKSVSIIPEYDTQLERPLIGVGLTDAVTLSYDTLAQRLSAGFIHSYNVVAYSIDTMGIFVRQSYTQRSLGPVSETVAGPVGIFGLVQDIVQSSGQKLITNLAQLIALLSLSLALINVLPFPALDGGRMVFVLYEWITKKQPNAKLEQYVNVAGFTILLLLAVVISINDISKLLR